MFDSEATTRGITVSVRSRHLPERSEPGRWLFTYRIRIANGSDETVQLMARHWIITDAAGRVEEVRGPGVVGQQPVLAPGESFEYSSFCPLPTPFGTMEGSYQMVAASGEPFEIVIAPFTLTEPMAVN